LYIGGLRSAGKLRQWFGNSPVIMDRRQQRIRERSVPAQNAPMDTVLDVIQTLFGIADILRRAAQLIAPAGDFGWLTEIALS